jgi:nitrate reductase cytochrome c-type subunit
MTPHPRRWAALALLVGSGALAQGPAAPAIPHPIDGYYVLRQENNCLECHDKPRDIGRKQRKGDPLPAPATHYAKADGKPEIADGHFICTSCHKPK